MVIRLINTSTLQLEVFLGSPIPKYAILSHAWEPAGELSFQEMNMIKSTPGDPAAQKSGYKKVIETCQLAKSQGLDYAWVDTCCIDKTSSFELSEAINSMYRWYEEAEVCYALLSDYKDGSPPEIGLRNCKLFTRGWCLQELLAPQNLVFYDAKWTRIGSKQELASIVSEICHIEEEILLDSSLIASTPIARRMSWAANRITTLPEDTAYSLLGIFNINMPMLYGEGTKAFLRLQHEIVKTTNDLSIFVFSHPYSYYSSYTTLFAPSPRSFSQCSTIQHASQTYWNNSYTLTNKGLHFHRAKLDIDFTVGIYRMDLHCRTPSSPKHMYLKKVGPGLYAQLAPPSDGFERAHEKVEMFTKVEKDIYILTGEPSHVVATAKENAIHLQCSTHDISRALEIIGRSATSHHWDASSKMFFTAGEKDIIVVWKLFPKLLRPVEPFTLVPEKDYPAGPVYVVVGLDGGDKAWVNLFDAEAWRQFERAYGIVTDVNTGFVLTWRNWGTADVRANDKGLTVDVSADVKFMEDISMFEVTLVFDPR